MSDPRNSRPQPVFLAFLTVLLCAGPAVAQDRPTVRPDEYGRWENLGAASLSPDGEWIAYRVTRVSGQNELRIARVAAGPPARVAEWGVRPVFSPDGRWLAWEIEVSEEERERLREAGDPVRSGMGLLDLAGGEPRTHEEVQSFAFDAEGSFLALHGYAPDEPEGKGADLRVLDLEDGSTMTFGNVAEFHWSDVGSVLALAVATGDDSGGNGVQTYDASTGRVRALDSSASAYVGLAWREGALDLAVLRSVGGASDEPTAHEVLAWRDVTTIRPRPLVLAAHHEDIDGDHEIVRHAPPRWSDDGAMVAIGLRPAEGEAAEDLDEQPDVTDAGGEGGAEASPPSEDEPELPAVQIWHSKDVRVYPQQTARRSADGRRTLLAVWHVDAGRVVTIGTDLLAGAELLGDWSHAVEDVAEPYGWGEMFGRPYHDVWLIDASTGERELRLERVRYEWPSPGGRYLVSFDGEDYSSHDLVTGETRNLTSGAAAEFADTEYDTPTDMLPPHGFAPVWLENDAGMLLYDKFDVWRVALDGSATLRLTDGAAEELIHRVAFLADDDVPGVDPAEPIYLTLHGDWTETRGYARVLPGGDVERLLLEDRSVSGLMRGDSADVYVYRSMAFDDPPDLFAAGPDLRSARRVSEINPFIRDYAWGRSELVDYVSESGRPLQAVLYYPADYTPGERVPTIVYTYEMRSQTIHNFQAPSERSYYNFTAWTQHGYAVLQPDIVYEAREPGMSALASVRAAVSKVVEMGVADPDAVGLIGHSWGGYQATFLPTRTNIFAASVAGAPLTDFVSFMGQIHWNSGGPELTHWETGQARMEVPFWEDPEAHRRNSPIHEVQNMETPLLMAFGDQDGTVDWDQGTEFYNFARRAGKQMVLLVYEGENHGFSDEANQIDYHRRILEWFGHYLKGEPAEPWITDGVKLDDLEREKRRVAKKNGAPPVH